MRNIRRAFLALTVAVAAALGTALPALAHDAKVTNSSASERSVYMANNGKWNRLYPGWKSYTVDWIRAPAGVVIWHYYCLGSCRLVSVMQPGEYAHTGGAGVHVLFANNA